MAALVKDARGQNTRKRYTVRFRLDGRQRERSFATLREARDFMAKVDHDTREHTFTDPKLGTEAFAAYAARVVAGMAVSDGTRKLYSGILRTWIEPFASVRTLAQVARDREGAVTLLNETMAHLSYNRRGIAASVLTATLDEAVAAGRLASHRLVGIRLTRPAADVADGPDDSFVFPSKDKITALADALNGYGVAVWLMRGCGLRVSEALAVCRADFAQDGAVLRVSGQASTDGRRKVALKHRKPGECRDVPVPAYLWELVRDLPDGPVLPGRDGARYLTYDTLAKRFGNAARDLGIPAGFTPHSLRHAFTSALLARGVPITDVAAWLGHRTISVTYRIYGHLVPSAAGRARAALDAEYAAWE